MVTAMADQHEGLLQQGAIQRNSGSRWGFRAGGNNRTSGRWLAWLRARASGINSISSGSPGGGQPPPAPRWPCRSAHPVGRGSRRGMSAATTTTARAEKAQTIRGEQQKQSNKAHGCSDPGWYRECNIPLRHVSQAIAAWDQSKKSRRSRVWYPASCCQGRSLAAAGVTSIR